MNKSFFTEILTKKPVLMQKMFLYNLRCDQEIPQPVQKMADYGLDVKALWQLSTVKAKFPYEQKSPAYWDFADVGKRLALLDYSYLKKLTLYFGMAFNSKNIANSILKEQVLEIREAFGEELYAYAISRAQFILNHDSQQFEILGYFDKEKPLKQKVILDGLSALCIISNGWEVNLREVFFKNLYAISKDYDISEKQCETMFLNYENISAEVKNYFWFSLQKIASKELNEIWAVYFK